MGKYILKRLGQSLIVVFIVTVIVFGLMHMLPGDPVKIYLGESATEEQIVYYTQMFGLDKPLYVQYAKWIVGLFKGEMGTSIVYHTDVSALLLKRVRCTLSVTVPAFVLALVLGVILGVVTATHRGKKLDSIITSISNVGIATPTFWIGIILVYILALKLNMLPSSGYVSMSESVGGHIKSLIMPVFVLSLGYLASTIRQTRSSMLEVISQDYIRTAWAKGLSGKTVIYKHALRNALIPIVTVTGNTVGGLIGGTVIIENLFNIPGVGSLMLTAIMNKDYMVAQNITFLIAVVVVVCNLAIDILYGYIDPRIRVAE
ncbi:MAG: ABC transporter permease [Lachnospiraceae bacterium]|nr:ABC transporter permease [Lachnospiraceae bacterium]